MEEVIQPNPEAVNMDQTPQELENIGKTKEQIAQVLSEKLKDLTPEQLIEKLAEKEEIITHKNRAIESLKKKSPEPVEVKPAEAPVDISKQVEEMVNKAVGDIKQTITLDEKIKNFSSDVNEQQAIREAYDKSIVKSGNVDADLENALAIANQNLIKEYKKNKSAAEVNEMIMTKFSSGNSYGPGESDAISNNPVLQKTAENLRKLGFNEEDIKKAINNIK